MIVNKLLGIQEYLTAQLILSAKRLSELAVYTVHLKHLYISNFRFHLLFTNRTCLLNMRNLHMEELALYNLCAETRPLSPFFPPRSSRHPSLYPHLATPAGCDASPGHSWPPEIATGSPGPPLFPPLQPFVHDAALRHFKQFVSHDAAESR